MKRLLMCLLLLSCTSIMWSHLSQSKAAIEDTVMNQVFEIGPELNVEEYNQKSKLFTDSLAYYLIKNHPGDILIMKDTVVINFVANGYGYVDSVWLVSPRTYPSKNICEFIKRYDFQGPLAKYYTSNPELYDSTMKLILHVDREARIFYLKLDFINTKRRNQRH